MSVDTWRAEVARAALGAGAEMINDVSGLTEPLVADACAEAGAALVVTHTRTPPKVKGYPDYDDVVGDVVTLLSERMAEARARGVGEDRARAGPGHRPGQDPGRVGHRAPRARRGAGAGPAAAAGPVAQGLHRGDHRAARPSARLAGTLAAVGCVADGAGSILRVHDVAAVRDYLKVRAALRGEQEVPAELRLAEELRREPEVLGA